MVTDDLHDCEFNNLRLVSVFERKSAASKAEVIIAIGVDLSPKTTVNTKVMRYTCMIETYKYTIEAVMGSNKDNFKNSV